MSTTYKNSLLLALVVGSLAGPAAATAKPVYEPGDAPRTRAQSQAAVEAGRPAASYYTARALHAMGARGQAQSEFYATPSASSSEGQQAESTGDRWGADAYAKSPTATFHAGQILKASGDRWVAQGAFNKSRSSASHGRPTAAVSQSTSSRDDGSNVLTYILVAIGLLIAGTAALIGMLRLFDTGSKPRIALP